MDVNVMREQTCCFTGHRELPPQELDQIVEGLKTTIAALITKGIRYFGAGGALGFDVLAARTVLNLRRQYPHIRLILVLPCHSHTIKWAAKDIAEYEQIRTQANKVVYGRLFGAVVDDPVNHAVIVLHRHFRIFQRVRVKKTGDLLKAKAVAVMTG